jgi:O-antigen/teichoic acid export membrane protein
LTNKEEKNYRDRQLTNKTLSGLSWMFTGAGAQAILQMIVLIILARLVTPEEFGIVTAALIVIGFSEIFSSLGIGPAIVQRPLLNKDHIKTGFSMSILLGLSFFVLILVFTPLISTFFQMEELIYVLSIISLTFPIKGLSVVAESLLQREMAFRKLANIQVLSFAAGYGLVGIVLALSDFGIWALVGANLCQALLKTVLLLKARPHPKSLKVDKLAFNELMYFGSGFTLARIFNYTALQGDSLIVGRVMGAVALGVYGRSYQLMAMPARLFGQVLDKVLFPAMASVQNDKIRLTKAYMRGVSLITLLVLPTSVIIALLSPEIIFVLLGSEWMDATTPFQILVAGMLFRTSYKMSESIARATGAVYKRAWRQGIYAICIIVGTWIGTAWGLQGVAIGVITALFINFLLMAQLSLNLIDSTWKKFISVHIPSIIISFFIFSLNYPIIRIMRSEHFSEWVIILVTALITLVFLILTINYKGAKVLGDEAEWMLKKLKSFFLENTLKKVNKNHGNG